MEIIYQVRIGTDHIASIDSLLGTVSESRDGFWIKSIHQKEGEQGVDFTKIFRDLIEPHLSSIRQLTWSEQAISVWVLYEYDQQCNFELSADNMRDILAIEAYFCISCWEG